MIIEGGTGNGYSTKVTKENQLFTYSTTISELATISFMKADAYTVSSTLSNIATGSCIFFFRNTDTQRSFLTHKIVLGASIATQFDIYQNSTYAASTGTAIVPVNLAAASGKVALCTCVGTVAVATVTPGKQVARYYISASESIELDFGGAPILGLNNDIAIFVTNASSTNTIGVTMTGYYKEGIL